MHEADWTKAWEEGRAMPYEFHCLCAVERGGAGSERVLDVTYADFGPVGQDTYHVEPQSVIMRFSGVEEVSGDGAQRVLFAGGDGLEWVSEASSAPQFHFDEDERFVLAHDQVDLPSPRPVVALDQRVTEPDQVPQREVFTPGPGGFVFQSPTPA